MADTASNFRGLVLSGSEIKALTGWTDPMVEDYLNILQSLITLAEAIDDITSTESDLESQLFSVPFLPSRRVPDSVSIISDYFVPASQRVICVNGASITVYLNDTPDDMEFADITRAGEEITIDGNGRTINGETSVTVTAQYTTLNIVYVLDIDGWIIS